MKGATMKVTMEKLGITASYSRPRVSNDNPFSEALFRTCKYRPDWPTKGFATKADAQAWVRANPPAVQGCPERTRANAYQTTSIARQCISAENVTRG